MQETGGTSRYIILGMLARMPLTGYSIRKWMKREYSHFWQISFGQIYPTLKVLVAEGLATRSDDIGDGRKQIVYTITESGRDMLSEWLRREPAVEKLRYEILLKISFGSHTEPDVLLRHLDDFIRRNERLMEDMNHYLSLFASIPNQNVDTTYSRLTALCGSHLYTAMHDWALEAKEIIQQKERKQP